MMTPTPFRLHSLPFELRFMIYEHVATQTIITRDAAYLPPLLLTSKAVLLEATRPISKYMIKNEWLATEDPAIIEPTDGELNRYQRFREVRLNEIFGARWSDGNEYLRLAILEFERARAPRYREWWALLAAAKLDMRVRVEREEMYYRTRTASKRVRQARKRVEERRVRDQ